jgi:hypothetical protein
MAGGDDDGTYYANESVQDSENLNSDYGSKVNDPD